MNETVKIQDPGDAARAAWAAAVLYARISGYNAENDQRKVQGYAMAYVSDSYEAAIAEAHRIAVGQD